MPVLPQISVLMTAYNREGLIAEAIESVLASGFSDWELIIVDDCSKDNTYNIARAYAVKDNRIKLFLNDKNLGDYTNRNKAASYATGKYIKYLDSDDVIFPDGLQYCVREMERFPQAGMGMLYLRDRNMQASIELKSEQAIRDHFFSGSILSIGPSGSIYRRDIFEKIGGFDVSYGVASDNMFNLKMAIEAPVVFFHRVFFDYRIHDAQENKNHTGYLVQNYRYNRDILSNPRLPLIEKEKQYLHRKLQKRMLVNITAYAAKEKSARKVAEIISSTGFKWWNAYKYIFY